MTNAWNWSCVKGSSFSWNTTETLSPANLVIAFARSEVIVPNSYVVFASLYKSYSLTVSIQKYLSAIKADASPHEIAEDC